MKKQNIRNFCIIAHIDHGKSTLADRFLEVTGTVQKRKMQEQLLDQMDIERERGITIKLTPVRMDYKSPNGEEYMLNLIDTPGHVDFSYEVSRSLAAVEGAVLLVDATQGIQAQTLANLYLALDQNLEIIPVANKIDLPAADPEKIKKEITTLLGCEEEDIVFVSAKTGKNVEQVLEKVVEKVAPPQAIDEKPLQSLIFDSVYDEYKGIIAYVRVVDGEIKKGDKVKFMSTGMETEVLEVGCFKPKHHTLPSLQAGEIGYIIPGVKELGQCRVGDTIANVKSQNSLPGYKEVKPFVYAGIFCKEGNEFERLRDAMEKLLLNDSALTYEVENNNALGFGFRCGFLGMLHLEIVQERLRREYNLDLIVTIPSVEYRVFLRGKGEQFLTVNDPQELPDPGSIEKIQEPLMKVDVVCPKEYIGGVMQIVAEKRGVYIDTEYLDQDRAVLHYKMLLSSIIVDFYDKLKSASSGYASLNYEFFGYQTVDVVRLDILVAEKLVEPLSTMVHKEDAYNAGRQVVDKLKDILPRQMFDVKIQSAIGAKIIASARLSAMRKDVTAKLYGGDVTRKRKLLEKQKKGKQKMKSMGIGKVDIPPEAFIAVLKR